MSVAPLLALLLLSADVDSKVASVLPSKDEDKWLSIPWRMNLMSARKEAQESGKPMFLWIMNGHPMGCT
jgi:hypothetical protein